MNAPRPALWSCWILVALLLHGGCTAPPNDSTLRIIPPPGPQDRIIMAEGLPDSRTDDAAMIARMKQVMGEGR